MDCLYCGSKTFSADGILVCTSCAKTYRDENYIPPKVEREIQNGEGESEGCCGCGGCGGNC